MAATVSLAGDADLDDLRQLFREYAGWLKVGYCLKDFEAELAGLPGDCVPPAGGLWIAWVDGAPAGCVALKPLGDGAVELKRLWVRPEHRGLKLGRRLAEAALAGGRGGGRCCIVLETLGFMTAAQALYADLGFREVPKGDAPENVRRLRRDLAAAAA
ncbi:MAG: GNAT family N-acetyltransferase [Bacteroidota bacterium]